jgi:hypothetical protein
VWFFGTTLDAWALPVPRDLWRLPWHRGRVRFDCTYDAARFGLFDRLGVVPFAEQARPHCVLIQPRTGFTIYLPPGLL